MLALSLYESFFRHAPTGNCLLSPTPEAIILAVNDAFLVALLCNREDLLGRSLPDVLSGNPDDPTDSGAAAVRASIARVLAEGRTDALLTRRYPIPVRQPDGGIRYEERFWNAVNTPVFGEDGRPICIVHTAINVTAQVRIEAALRESEQRAREAARGAEAERRRLDAVLHTAPVGIVVADASGALVHVNAENRRLWGENHPVPRNVSEYGRWNAWWADGSARQGQPLAAEDWPMARALRGESSSHEIIEIETFDPTVKRRVALVSGAPIRDGDEIVGGIVVLNDISRRIAAERALKEVETALRLSEEQFRALVEHTAQAVWEADANGVIVADSPSWRAYTGQTVDEWLGYGWLDAIHPEDREYAERQWRDAVAARVYVDAEFRLQRARGGWHWTNVRAAPLFNPDGSLRKWVGMNIDISDRKAAEESTWRHANFDTLTGLPNRRLFRDRLEIETARALRRSDRLALLFVDLDRFKQINDLLGHDAGDLLLAEAARRIRRCVRETDTVARLGGDEFTVILPAPDHHDLAEQASQKILEALARPFALQEEVVHVSGSIGIAVFPDDAPNAEELLRKADQAMYAAKQAGKNQFSYFTAQMDERAHYRVRVIHGLRGALRARQLSVRYQPVVDLVDGSIVKAEALLRWHHPVLGEIGPSEFIPLAEEAGIISELGDWVFEQAAACAKTWSARLGRTFSVGVNKSPAQFMTKGCDRWLEHLHRLDVPAANITIEITEGLLLHASRHVADRLFEYRDAGIQVALDDFGTGYSSLAYLKKFDIDYLKIDQSFVRDIATDMQNRTIAESIVAMAHKLGLKVIAEGIETTDQKRTLADAGCDFGQGFLFAAPLPADEFETLLLGRQAASV
ncbi:MAG: sensor domain-containing protein [Burkholderiaceae bacterium]